MIVIIGFRSKQLSLSNMTHVYLSRTDLESEGVYSCEVSSEAPFFSTVKAEKQMKVYGKSFLEYFVYLFEGCRCWVGMLQLATALSRLNLDLIFIPFFRA